jgi:hypothetical protein
MSSSSEQMEVHELGSVRSGEKLSPGLREDEIMGETFRGSAIPLTEQRTDQMILIISITIVFALAVGGFVMAANIYEDQDQSPTDDVQQIVKDCFDPAETAQLQALREPDFVMESESGRWGPFDTEQGWILWDGYYLPSELPLCINNDTIANWYIMVLSYGGYEPYGGSINVTQKYRYKGTIYIDWTYAGKGEYECCAYDWWTATFYVAANFCLDSNQYPMCSGLDGFIPDKEVYFYYDTYWTGCGHESQHFTMIHSHSYWAFSKCFILTRHTQTLNPHQNNPFRSLSGAISE